MAMHTPGEGGGERERERDKKDYPWIFASVYLHCASWRKAPLLQTHKTSTEQTEVFAS